jgi:DNA-directed RNA polymerase subunit RPC12/RpoP
LHWHSGGARNEAQKFDIAWRCTHCGAAGVVENAYSNNDISCVRCNHSIQIAERKLVLRPSGFVTDFYESTTNDISTQKFIRVAAPRIQLNGETLALPDSRCGHLHFGHNGNVFYHSSGEHERGYAICLACGRAESMTQNGEVPTSLRPDASHRPVGGPKGAQRDKSCSGASVKSNIHLGYQTTTDVLELTLRSPLNGEWLGDSPKEVIIATTLAVALRDAIADEIGIASTEMGFGTRLDRDTETGKVRSVIQLFDQVSGGAGFVLAALPQFIKLVNKAVEKLTCKHACENICSACLAGQDSRVEQEELDRRGALEWVNSNKLLSHLQLPAQFNRISGASYCSFSPERFVQENVNKGASTIQLLLQGESINWDLDHPLFREKILTWKVKDLLEVYIGLPPAENLSREIRQSLSFLARLGVRIGQYGKEWCASDVTAVMQIYGNDTAFTLLSNCETAGVPGENWLISNASNIWVSTDQFKPLDLMPVDMTGWDAQEPSQNVLEVISELNGPVSSLKSRLINLIQKDVPDLANLIARDYAVKVTYSDRYLKSPWSLMVAAEFLSIFKNNQLNHLEIATLLPQQLNKVCSSIKHDWTRPKDMEDVVQGWFKSVLSITPLVTMTEKTYEMQHGRVISIVWASGQTSKIILDQGVGYWQPRAAYRDEMDFNFNASIDVQLNRMSEQYNSTNMMNGGAWPTFLSFV